VSGIRLTVWAAGRGSGRSASCLGNHRWRTCSKLVMTGKLRVTYSWWSSGASTGLSLLFHYSVIMHAFCFCLNSFGCFGCPTVAVSSEHEGQVDIRDAVADVEGSVDWRVASVVAEVAWPELVAQDSDALGRILQDAPAEVGLVCCDAVEEFLRVDCLVSSDQIFLLSIFDFAEVLPSAKFKGVITG
jgi:hypothetical protein